MIKVARTNIGHAVCRSKRSSASWDPAIGRRPRMPSRQRVTESVGPSR